MDAIKTPTLLPRIIACKTSTFRNHKVKQEFHWYSVCLPGVFSVSKGVFCIPFELNQFCHAYHSYLIQNLMKSPSPFSIFKSITCVVPAFSTSKFQWMCLKFRTSVTHRPYTSQNKSIQFCTC